VKIRLLLVDDHKIVRDGLRSLLRGETDMEVAAEAENGLEALRLAEKLNPDVIVMDVSMPDMNGIDAARAILERSPRCRIVALSMYSDRRFVEGMLRAGVAGYMLKDGAFEELARAIRAVAAGQAYLSPCIAETVIKDYVHSLEGGRGGFFPELSARERQVLQLVAEGKSTRNVAETLHVSVKTVETHRRQIMEKLNVRSVAELTKCAIREGLTSLDL